MALGTLEMQLALPAPSLAKEVMLAETGVASGVPGQQGKRGCKEGAWVSGAAPLRAWSTLSWDPNGVSDPQSQPRRSRGRGE